MKYCLYAIAYFMKAVVVFFGWGKESLKNFLAGFFISFVIRTSVALLICLAATGLRAVDVNVRLANLTQDLELLSRQVANLRSEVEILRRENAQLRIVAEQGSKSQGVSQAKLLEFGRQMDSQLVNMRREISQSNANAKILKQHVDSNLQRLIKQMNAGFAAHQKTAPSPVPEPHKTSFGNEYPKDKGFVHVVEKGETVSSIAKKYKSKVPWIINANQISDPTKVHVGKDLFVPQE